VKIPRRYVFFLLLLNVIVALAGYLVFLIADRTIRYSDVLLLLAGFSLISLVTVIIFHRGQEKDSQSKVLYTLVSLGLKFLLELVLALLWFVVAKKTSTTSVIIFFVLYLTLTLFSVIYISKILKDKPL
jgi:F0F1-type ATP synthase assembly protein I